MREKFLRVVGNFFQKVPYTFSPYKLQFTQMVKNKTTPEYQGVETRYHLISPSKKGALIAL